MKAPLSTLPAGIIALIGGRALGFVPSCLSAAVVLALVLTLTHPVDGLPLLAFGLRTLRGLATGSGPFGHFLNGHTNVDFSIAGQEQPRIFSFHEMEEDEVLIAIAYTQVLAALMRTAMADDSPRVIAVDEVYRMMRHPALLKFLINAVKTLRTKRKKVIVIDQQMRIFVQDPQARLLFENCPIRVIFAQRGGEDVFAHDPAFAHYTGQHRKIIAELPRFRFLMETDEGIFYLHSEASRSELRRYGSS